MKALYWRSLQAILQARKPVNEKLWKKTSPAEPGWEINRIRNSVGLHGLRFYREEFCGAALIKIACDELQCLQESNCIILGSDLYEEI